MSDVGSDELPWWQLASLLQHLPRDGAVARDVLGEAAEWSVDSHIAAYAADAAWVAVWQNGSGKKSDYPTPIPRPGQNEHIEEADERIETFGGPSMTLEQIERFRPRIEKLGGDDVSLPSLESPT